MKKAVIVILLVVIIILLASSKKYIEEPVKFAYPVNGRLTSKFGEKRSNGTVHNGIDLAAASGTPVLAPEKGIVTSVWKDSINGNALKMLHYQGYTTGYAHLSKVSVKVGDTITKGQKIGEIGSTGRSTGPHLHFVVRQYGLEQDPLKLIKA